MQSNAPVVLLKLHRYIRRNNVLGVLEELSRKAIRQHVKEECLLTEKSNIKCILRICTFWHLPSRDHCKTPVTGIAFGIFVAMSLTCVAFTVRRWIKTHKRRERS